MQDDVESRRDLIVMGASSGGVDTLKRVVAGLPPDLPAAVCIVLHIAPSSPSALARILHRAGPLSCRQAADGDPLVEGEILVAPPDRHLVIEHDRARLTADPPENGHRPAVDVLFRSAAAARDGRVIGVVLSGNQDDGTAGLAAIKATGGATIVQDPAEALYAGMPNSALAHVAVDSVARSEVLAETIAAMVRADDFASPAAPRNAHHAPPPGDRVICVCPECGGVLTEEVVAGVPQWRCMVGHRYSPESLADAQGASVEAALWTAIRALHDRSVLLDRIAVQSESRGQPQSARSFRRKAHGARQQTDLIRAALGQAATATLHDVAEDEIGELVDPKAG